VLLNYHLFVHDCSASDFFIQAGLHPNPPNNLTVSLPRNIFLNYIGTYQPTVVTGQGQIRSSNGNGELRLEVGCGDFAVTGCQSNANRSILFQPQTNGSIEIQGNYPAIVSNTNITFRTMNNDANIYLIPNGNGVVNVGGANHISIGSRVNQSMISQFRSKTPNLVLRPVDNVVLNTTTPTVRPRDGKRMSLLTLSDNKNINLEPNGSGHVS
jgi:hypothetical protein